MVDFPASYVSLQEGRHSFGHFLFAHPAHVTLEVTAFVKDAEDTFSQADDWNWTRCSLGNYWYTLEKTLVGWVITHLLTIDPNFLGHPSIVVIDDAYPPWN